MRLKLKEYAKHEGISLSAVYKRIDANKVEVEEDKKGVKYIVIDEPEPEVEAPVVEKTPSKESLKEIEELKARILELEEERKTFASMKKKLDIIEDEMNKKTKQYEAYIRKKEKEFTSTLNDFEIQKLDLEKDIEKTEIQRTLYEDMVRDLKREKAELKLDLKEKDKNILSLTVKFTELLEKHKEQEVPEKKGFFSFLSK